MIDVILIGAGAAGLSAARMLSRSGKSVCILEARDRIGGRIHTLKDEGFSIPAEGGAEFMHGELPLSKALMKEVNVTYRAGEGSTWNVQQNQLSEGDLSHDDWGVLMQRLQQVDQDLTIGDFLDQYFKEPAYESLTNAVKRFVQGYDAADITKASALALRDEWSGGNVQGFRPVGGYSQLMEFLWSEIQKHNGILKLSTTVKKITWKHNHVEILTDKNKSVIAHKVLITVPVSVLKLQSIQFDPPLLNHQRALRQLEVGGVIKFLFEFKSPFWEQSRMTVCRQMRNLNFLFSDAFVPTWWTQKPSSVPLLTGWLSGSVVQSINQDNDSLLAHSFESLAYVFDCKEDFLKRELRVSKVINWSADPYSTGAYAYKTLQTSMAIKLFTTPVENTLYFAGEALYDGPEMGTVEAALASGHATAEKVIKE
jgi:monoamine oxidase